MSKSKQQNSGPVNTIGGYLSREKQIKFNKPYTPYYKGQELFKTHWIISQTKPVFCCGCANRIIHDSEYYHVEDLVACTVCYSIIHCIRWRRAHTHCDPEYLFRLVLPRVSYQLFREELNAEHTQDHDSRPWGCEPEMSFEKRGVLKIRKYRKTKVQICYLDSLKV